MGLCANKQTKISSHQGRRDNPQKQTPQEPSSKSSSRILAEGSDNEMLPEIRSRKVRITSLPESDILAMMEAAENNTQFWADTANPNFHSKFQNSNSSKLKQVEQIKQEQYPSQMQEYNPGSAFPFTLTHSMAGPVFVPIWDFKKNFDL